MTDNKRDGGPAFPVSIPGCGDNGWHGMSLRDYFAGQALVGFLADGSARLIAEALEDHPDRALIQDSIAKAAIINQQMAIGVYRLADAMLAAREATP